MLNGERARHAEQLAARQGDDQYRYHVNAINVMKSASGTRVVATVLLWNDQALRAIAVDWSE